MYFFFYNYYVIYKPCQISKKYKKDISENVVVEKEHVSHMCSMGLRVISPHGWKQMLVAWGMVEG